MLTRKIQNDGVISDIIAKINRINFISVVKGAWGYYFVRSSPEENFSLYYDVQDTMYPCTCYPSNRSRFTEDDVIYDLLEVNRFKKSYNKDKKFELWCKKYVTTSSKILNGGMR